MSDYWFKPRRYGYGATPTNWKGWLSIIAFLVIIVALSNFAAAGSGDGGASTAWTLLALISGIGILTAGFVVFARSKTEGEWRWRWGDKDSN